ELKLAGLRINPKTFSDSRFSFGSELWLISTVDGAERRISGLPQPLSVASLAWSPDQRYLAFNQLDPASGRNELWLVDVAAGSARKLAERLNSVATDGYAWLPGGDALLVMQRPAGQGEAPAGDGVPTGPAVQETVAGQGVREERCRRTPVRALPEGAAAAGGDQRPERAVRRPRPVPGPVGLARWQLPARPARGAAVLLRGAGEPFPAPHRGARCAGPRGAHGGEAAAGRGPADRQRRRADRRARDRLARRCAGHAGLGRSAGRRRPLARGGHPRRGADAGRTVREAAGHAGAAGFALCRHHLGGRRAGAAGRILVEEP